MKKVTFRRIITVMLAALLFAGNVLPCAFTSYAETEVVETAAVMEAGEAENEAAQENGAAEGTAEAASEEKADNAEAPAEQSEASAEAAPETAAESEPEAEPEGQAEAESAAEETQPEGQEESAEAAEAVTESEGTTEAAEGSETTAEAETQETAAEEATEEPVNTEASEPASELASPSNAEYGQGEVAEAPAEEEGKKVYTETVDGVTVTVTADAGVFPEGAELHVEKVEKEEDEELDAQLEKALSKERKAGRKQSGSIVFDIKMLVDGEEVQPDNEKGEVYVSFTMEGALNSIDEADIYHIHEEEKNESTIMTAEKLKVLTEEESEKVIGEAQKAEESEDIPADGAISNDLKGDNSIVEEVPEREAAETTGELLLTAKTDGFSYYIVEFSYEELNYEIEMLADAEDGNRVSIRSILWRLGFNDECWNLYEIELNESEELTLEPGDYYDLDSWYINVNKAFTGTRQLRLTEKAYRPTPRKTYVIEISCPEIPAQAYHMTYRPGTKDENSVIRNMPERDEGKGGERYVVSDLIPERAGYEFIDWTLYWKEYYTVYYLEEGTEFILAEPKVVSGVEAGETVTENAIGIENFILKSDSEQSITITEDGDNIIKFYYEEILTDYTVMYKEKGTDERLMEDKCCTSRRIGTKVAECACEIEGYVLADDVSKEITLKADSADNVIVFYYTRMTTGYTVEYCELETGNLIHEPKTVPNNTDTRTLHPGETVTEYAEEIDNYYLYDGKNYFKQTLNLRADPYDNYIVFYYTQFGESYTVNYLEIGTERQLAPSKLVKEVTYRGRSQPLHIGKEITENAIDIDGYMLADSSGNKLIGRSDDFSEVSIRIQKSKKYTYDQDGNETVEDIAKNEITFYYKKALTGFTVLHIDKDSDEILYEESETDCEVGSHITRGPIEIENYDPVSTDPQTITLTGDADQNIITIYYEKAKTSYTVYYQDYHTHEDIDDPTVVEGVTVGIPVKVNAKTIDDWVITTRSKRIIPEKDPDSNVVIFYYSRLM